MISFHSQPLRCERLVDDAIYRKLHVCMRTCRGNALTIDLSKKFICYPFPHVPSLAKQIPFTMHGGALIYLVWSQDFCLMHTMQMSAVILVQCPLIQIDQACNKARNAGSGYLLCMNEFPSLCWPMIYSKELQSISVIVSASGPAKNWHYNQ